METSKRKRVAAVTAGALALAVALTGTFAWQSISQEATNEAAGLINPGGRLHDDFDGENKDVYVENFTEEATGGQPIYARIRLDEYMEIGEGAGLKDGDEGYADKKTKPLVDGADINDPTTWRTHLPDTTDDKFHDYFTWTTGGKTIFLPTFNKNKDSLAADINGTFEGTTPNDDTHYDDYKTYTVGQDVPGDAIYDADTNDTDEGDSGAENVNYTKKSETHTAKETLKATVMTMDEWITAGSIPGPYWVWDEDGWAYWAQAILPQEATGLLLDGFTEKKSPEGKWYYGINVIGQFVTADDFGNATDATGFFSSDAGTPPSDNAMTLLNQAAATTHVTNADGKMYIGYKDNTFKELKDDGTLGDLLCAGVDGIPGNTDDRTDIVVLTTPNATYGSKFLGPDATDDFYMAAGKDGKLGTADDIKVWATSGTDLTTGITETQPTPGV